MSENTKKRSLDKLFGTKRNVRSAEDSAAEQTNSENAEVITETASRSTRKRSPSNSKRSAESTKTGSPTPASEPVTPTIGENEDVGPGGYLGKGRYRRGDGVLVKPSIYVRPDQVHALRMSAAAKDDPNGETMSEIIQSLLDQNGYCDPG